MEEKKRIEGENVDANNGKASSTHQQVITSTKNKQQQLADTFSKISNKASSSELTKTVQTLRERGISPEEVLKAVQEQQKLEKAGLTTMDALRNAGTIADIKNTVKEMIEHNSPDIEFFTQGSEGMIYKMKVVIDNTFHTFIAMKKRFDNNISHESKMLAHANNLVVDSDRKGFSTPAIRAKVPNFIGPVSAKDLEDGTKIAEYLVMEYVEGKTLYTLQLEAIIKKMQEKVRTLKLFTFEEWEAEFLENLKKERLKEKEQKLEKKRAIFTDNLSNAENQLRSKSPEQKKKLMQQIKEKYEQELKEQEAAIKNAYFLR
ncbi:MAG: hypothetical protein LBU27_03410 [Candidatus Peribacteria bacterium]|jgi:hypothetical protein|nr:hypothetical protein [Candidatus Peribacteria bacterium]